MHHSNQASIRVMKSSWSAGSTHVSWNFFFVWVYIVHPVSSLRMKSESFERPILCYCQFFFPDSVLALNLGGLHVTLTDTKQDRALRQGRQEPG